MAVGRLRASSWLSRREGGLGLKVPRLAVFAYQVIEGHVSPTTLKAFRACLKAMALGALGMQGAPSRSIQGNLK